MRKVLGRLVLPTIVLSAPALMMAQDNAGMTGTVTDATGATVPNTTVALTNARTGLTFTQTTNSQGNYRFPNVPPQGGYQITFTHPGFATVTVKDLELNVATTRTQNVSLVAGDTSTVEVTSNPGEVLLNTTDARIGNTFDVKQVNDLPIQDRSSLQTLFTLQPGVTSTGSVTGARSDQNSVTLDGMDINDIASGQTTGTFPTTGGAPPDAVQEFTPTVAGLPTILGTGSGGQFQLVTKSGTNKFHGDLNEYHRDVSTAANAWFNLNTTPALPRPKLIRNQFGGAIGGPITIPHLYNGKDRLFFFFDFNNGRTVQQSSTTRTVPLDSFRNGVIGYINNSATTCNASSRRTTSPSCISELTSAQLATQSPTASGPYDPLAIGFDATLLSYINTRYPHANDLSLGDGVNTGGYRFQQSTPQNLYNYVGKIDYNLTSKQRVFLQYHTIRTDGVQALSEFDTDPLTFPNQNRSYGYVGSHVWQIGNNKVNQFYYGDTVSVLKFPVNFSPTGSTSFGFGGLSAPNGSLSSQNRRVPIPELRDDFNWTVGTHNLQFGGTFKFIKTNSRLTNDYNFVTVGLGGNTTALDATMRPTNLNTATAAISRYDSLFATALGHIGAQSRNYNYTNTGAALPVGTGAIRRYRYYQTEVYAGDTWKASPSLTINYGIRYQYYSVPFEANGTQSNINLGFDEYLAARVTQSAASSSGNTAVPFLTYNLGGKANNGPDIYKPSYKDFAPRFSFAYNPQAHRNTVVSGGFGLDYDRTVVNAINFVQDQLSYLFQNTQTTAYGQSNSRAAFAADPRVGANLTYPAAPLPVALTKPYTPYVSSAGVPTGINSGNVNYAVDKNFKTPYSLAFNMNFQQSLRGGFVVQAAYVGRLGRRLIGQADASQLVDYKDPTSGQLLSQAFANLSLYLRNNPNATKTVASNNAIPTQPWFENQISSNLGLASKTAALSYYRGSSLVAIGDFADTVQFLQGNNLIGKNVGLPAQFAADTFITNKGYSAYHGGLLTVSKSMRNGLQFQFNYTYSHSTDNVSTVANYIGLNTGTGQVCDALVRSSCYGNSDFDVTHNIRSTFVYELPFGRGRTFGANMNRALDLAVGGWKVSGIPTYRSGYAFATTTGAYLAGYSNNVPGVFNGDRSAVKVRLHKDANGALQLFDDPIKAAAAFSNPLGFQYGSRNNLRGPSAVTFDTSVSKSFAILSDNRLSFKLQGDGFNVLNHPTFSTPSVTNINSGSTFGNITTVDASSRVIQISGRLEF